MTTFNSLGSQFADLEDKIKQEGHRAEAAKSETLAFIDAWERQLHSTVTMAVADMRKLVENHFTLSSTAIAATLGYETHEPMTEEELIKGLETQALSGEQEAAE